MDPSPFSNDNLAALLSKVFGPPPVDTSSRQRPPPTQLTSVTIPEDFRTADLNRHFAALSTALSNPATSVPEILSALNYLSDEVLRDHHRFLPYLERYAGDLLAGCAKQLEHFLTVEYPKILVLPADKNSKETEPTRKAVAQARRLLQSLAIVTMNLVISEDFNRHIPVSAFSALFSTLIGYYLEAQYPRSPAYNYSILYLIADDASLWIEDDVHRGLAPNQIEAIFETLYSLLNETKGKKELTESQWRRAQCIFSKVDTLRRRIHEVIDPIALYRQGNRILGAFPGSAFQAEGDYRPVDFLADSITGLIKKKGAQGFHLEPEHFNAKEPIVGFTRKLTEEVEILKSSTEHPKKTKVTVEDGEDDIELDLGFGLFDEEPRPESPPKAPPRAKRSPTPLECPVDPPKPPPEPELPVPTIRKVPLSNADQITIFLEQISHLKNSTNPHEIAAVCAYLNRNLDDFIRLHPGALEANVNQLISAISRVFNEIKSRQLSTFFIKDRQYFHEIVALLKRIFKYAHLVKLLDYQTVYPELLLNASISKHSYSCDYGYHELKETLFVRHHAVGLSLRLQFTIRFLTYIHGNERSVPFYDPECFAVKGIRRLTPGVGGTIEQVDQILDAIREFMPTVADSWWTIEDADQMGSWFDQRSIWYRGVGDDHFPGPHDVIRKLLYVLVKSQGESIWIDYQRVVPSDPERRSLLARFIRMAIDAAYPAQDMCTHKDQLRALEEPDYGQSKAEPKSEALQGFWNFTEKTYHDNTELITELTNTTIPTLKSHVKTPESILELLENLPKKILSYGKNPLTFGGSPITELFGALLELLKHQVATLDREDIESLGQDFKQSIHATLRSLETLLNLELAETNIATKAYPKYRLAPSVDQVADLIDGILSVRFHLKMYFCKAVLAPEWLLQYKPATPLLLAASAKLFTRSAKAGLGKGAIEPAKRRFQLAFWSRFLTDFAEKRFYCKSRDERLQLLAKRFNDPETLELFLEEAGRFTDAFKGSCLEKEHLYGTKLIIQELLTALVQTKTEMIRDALKKYKKSKEVKAFLERSLKRFETAPKA